MFYNFCNHYKKWVFYNCKNITQDDWQLVAVIFLKANTLRRNMTASHFEALYFMGVYYTAIGNTKVLHRECREHIWRMLSHVANHISMVVTFLKFWAA